MSVEGSRRYRRKHPAKIKAANREFREGNPSYARQHFAANRQAYRGYHRRWKADNREAVTAAERNRYARKIGAPGRGVSTAEWTAILADYGHRCAYCLASGKLEMDHIDPLSKGGSHDPENVAPACGGCNTSKRSRSLVVWFIRKVA